MFYESEAIFRSCSCFHIILEIQEFLDKFKIGVFLQDSVRNHIYAIYPCIHVNIYWNAKMMNCV